MKKGLAVWNHKERAGFGNLKFKKEGGKHRTKVGRFG